MTTTAPTTKKKAAPAAAISDEQLIAQDLHDVFHLNNAGIAAFLGGFQVESNFNRNAYNPNENAHGWAQWEGGRWTALQNIARRLGVAPTSSQAEIAQLNAELSGSYSGVIAQLRHVTDPTVAAQIVQSQYEGSTVASLGARQANARTIYAQLNAGQKLTGGGTSSGTGFLGVGQGAGAPDGPNPSHLPKKLTASLRAKMIAYINSFGVTMPKGFLEHTKDAPLIALYTNVWREHHGQAPTTTGPNLDPTAAIVSAIETVLAPLGRLAVNAFLIITGIILIVLAVFMLSRAAGVSLPTPSAKDAAAAA